MGRLKSKIGDIASDLKSALVAAKPKIKSALKVFVLVLIGLVTGSAITIAVTPEGETTVTTENVIVEGETIELANEQMPATVIDDSGTEVVDENIPTVEQVDGGEIATPECSEGQDCGRGWYVDTTSPITFRDAVLGQCVDVDGAYGSQCFDLANLFWQNYAGRSISSCGTGAAKGTLNCVDANAGGEFTMIYDVNQLQPGDWVVFTNGTWGHIGMAMGYPNNGYITLLGTNQGGSACAGGGSTANIINISLANFGGAFRPNAYIPPEPEPEPEPAPVENSCESYTVKAGDTMGQIMLDCTGKLDWNNWDEINAYANQWVSQIVRNGQTVYQGWNSATGVGLYAGDTILFNNVN